MPPRATPGRHLGPARRALRAPPAIIEGLNHPFHPYDFNGRRTRPPTDRELFETVTVRAEVLENLEITAQAGAASLGKAPNAPQGDSGQGELIQEVQLRVATVSPARDSEGNRVSFQANASGQGEDCTLAPPSKCSVECSAVMLNSLRCTTIQSGPIAAFMELCATSTDDPSPAPVVQPNVGA